MRAWVSVTVVYSPAARSVHEWPLRLPARATVLQALQALRDAGVAAQFPEIDFESTELGVWGWRAPLDQLLADQDRIEIYRPLKVDPKAARRARFRAQGVRAAGLFAKKMASR